MNDVEPPRISRRRAVVITAAGLIVAGALLGALWAWIAPSIHGVVALTKSGERIKAYLGNEADHFFLAAFLIVGMVSALAVVAAVLVWQWRAHRGPVMVAALAVGAAAAAGAAAGVGAVLVHWRYGAIDIAAAPVSPEHRVHYVVEAPAVFFGHSPLHIAATILFPAATAALVYALMAVSTQRDDLGAWPPQHEPDHAPTSSPSPADAKSARADAKTPEMGLFWGSTRLLARKSYSG
jgi:MFS family permease